jgi:hypothetical protein
MHSNATAVYIGFSHRFFWSNFVPTCAGYIKDDVENDVEDLVSRGV